MIEATDGEVPLYTGPELQWKRQFARLARVLIDSGARAPESQQEALRLLDTMIEGVNRRLPYLCRWPAGTASVYGPPGTRLPAIPPLVEAAFAEVVQQAAGQAGQSPS